ncbi:MAG: thiamine phosphate synthase [Rhodospirillales bacterium]|nr:thiamine phosphate synthase [Rhodospirillales bacterium]
MNPSAPTLAEVASRLKRPASAAGLPPLILMTDSQRLPDPLSALRHLPPGSAVIVRETDPVRRRVLARRLRHTARCRRIRMLIAADERLAREADGLHLSEAMARRGARRWRLSPRPGTLLTAAAHSATAIRRAAALGANAVLLAPVFATASHPGAPAIGPLQFARLVWSSPLPVYALGGIDAATAQRLLRSGAAGFAAIGALSPPRQSAGGSPGA